MAARGNTIRWGVATYEDVYELTYVRVPRWSVTAEALKKS